MCVKIIASNLNYGKMTVFYMFIIIIINSLFQTKSPLYIIYPSIHNIQYENILYIIGL